MTECCKYPNNIKCYRLRFYPRPLTQDEFAKLVRVHRNKICLYESGEVFPSGQILYRISIALNVPVEVLYKEYCDKERHAIFELKKAMKILPAEGC
jgi:transcriptional regulator with XRE-family HTH domain